MAILGLFGKKSKASQDGSKSAHTASTGSVETDDPSILSTSPRRNGVYAGPSAASSSKPMLGLFNKRSAQTGVTSGHLSVPTQRFSGARSDSGHDALELPPSRSTLFSADDRSTRSLPPISHTTSSREVVAVDATLATPPAKKSKGMFAWAHRERKQSKPQAPPTDVSLDPESFNLRGFRHVRPASPAPSEQPGMPRPPSSLSVTALTPPQRPRGGSVASDSSQRISVAAFREMAARRSAANSPSPSSVDLSRMEPSPSLRPPFGQIPASSPTLLPPPGQSPSPSPTSLLATTRRSTVPLSGSSDSSDSEESESEDGDSVGSATLRPTRDRATAGRTAGKAKATSELGHRTRPALPRLSPAPPSNESKETVYPRPRASHSTSALQPNAAAQRASMFAAERQSVASGSNAVSQARNKVPKPGRDSDSTSSSDDSDTDSDDAPLSRLVPPKRPGSATSSATAGSRTRIPSKPLIDISALDIKPPVISPEEPVSSSSISLSRSPAAASGKGKEKERDEPFSPVSILSATEKAPTPVSSPIEKPSLNDRLARLAQGAADRSVENLQKSPSPQPLEDKAQDQGTRDRSQPPAPSRSQTLPVDNLLAPSPPSPEPPSSTPPSPSTMPKKNGRSLSTPAVAFEGIKDLSDPTPIVPTPIHERSPPPAFSVTSRPTSQLSLSSPSQMLTSPHPMTTQQQQASHRQSLPSAVRLLPPRMQSSPPSSQPSEASSPSSTTPTRPGPLIADNGLPPAKGFTGGGLLASAAANSGEKDRSRRAAPSPTKRPTRQRAQSTNVLSRTEEPPTRPFVELNHKRHGSPSRLNDASSQVTSVSASSSSSSGQPKSILVPSSRQARPRSTTLGVVPPSAVTLPPTKPFAAGPRGYSPASSTGDSSSGRTPVTPRDGSELGYGSNSNPMEKIEFGQGRGAAAVGARRHRRGQNVTFDEPTRERGRAPARGADELDMRETNEEKRNERRRSEAKAAIELGNIVNGKTPIVASDDESDGVGLENVGPRMNMHNPMMAMQPMHNMNMNMAMSPQPQMPWMAAPSMPPPSPQQFMSMIPMLPPNPDATFLAAHQQAMHIAKQAYQMAVAHQAMAAAEEEWERGSNAAASVLSGMSRSTMAFPPPSAFGLGMPNMGGMGMGMGAWPNMIPNSSQSMYAGSTAGSELGMGSRGWGTRSAYGEPTGYRTSSFGFPAQPPPMSRSESTGNLLQSQQPVRPSPRPRTRTAPNIENGQQEGARSRQAPVMPPSSWKTAR